MWILKNSKDLLEYIQSRSLSSCNYIKIFDFSKHKYSSFQAGRQIKRVGPTMFRIKRANVDINTLC